jgi:hypothetical protein
MTPEALEQVADFTLRVYTPLFWHDRQVPFPKEVEGGSCFVLRFCERLVGVTADHVLRAYQAKRDVISTLVCQLRVMPFLLHEVIIDCDPDLDLATFRLSEAELAKIEGTPVDCRDEWPPPSPARLRALSLAGFPKTMIVTYPDRSASFRAYGALPAIEDFNERDILVTYDPARDQHIGTLPRPPLGLNLSGCSGGPVLMHGTRAGLHRWFPVGMINSGSKKDTGEPASRGEAEDFDTIRIRRIHFIREDGTIKRPAQSGWLPGR